MNNLNIYEIKGIIAAALLEDIGSGDITSQLIVPEDMEIRAELLAMEEGVIAGLGIAALTFGFENDSSSGKAAFSPLINEGEPVKYGQVFAMVQGSARTILSTERVALNFLQRLSGIATLTSRYVKAVEGYPVKIYDTRKTIPSLRMLDKYGVRAGGGYNHRFGLYDGILIKENHIRAAGGIKNAVERARAANMVIEVETLTCRNACVACDGNMSIEVETETLDEVKEAVLANADIIMLDNMDITTMKEAVGIIRGGGEGILIEASGGINLENIRDAAAAGVDRISIGALTHSPRALDISMEVVA